MEVKFNITRHGDSNAIVLSKKILRVLDLERGDALLGTLIDGELRLVGNRRYHLNDLVRKMPLRKNDGEQ